MVLAQLVYSISTASNYRKDRCMPIHILNVAVWLSRVLLGHHSVGQVYL
jgi:hypothetical protein